MPAMTPPGETPTLAGRSWWRWVLVVACMLAIFVSSSRSRLPDLPGEPSDKLLHFGAYGLLSALVIGAAVRGRWTRATGRLLLAAALASALYGLTDEVHQSFVPNRDASPADLAADALGAFGAAGAVWAWGIISRGGDRRDDV